MFFDRRSSKLSTFAVESLGRLGMEQSDLIDQLAASIVGAEIGVCKERLFQMISVTTDDSISQRVHRYKLVLRRRQAARGRREETGVLLPMRWR